MEVALILEVQDSGGQSILSHEGLNPIRSASFGGHVSVAVIGNCRQLNLIYNSSEGQSSKPKEY